MPGKRSRPVEKELPAVQTRVCSTTGSTVNALTLEEEDAALYLSDTDYQNRVNACVKKDNIKEIDISFADGTQAMLQKLIKTPIVPTIVSLTFRFKYSASKKSDDIAAISALTNLRSLDLSNNDKIVDISALKDLVHLKKLNLQSTEITDITALSAFKSQLEELLLPTTVSVFEPLANQRSLVSLDISDNRALTDLSVITTNLTELRKLTLVDCGSIENITGLSNLKNLTTLNVAGVCGLNDYDELMNEISELTELTSLNLSHVPTYGFPNCSKMTKLTSLNLSGTNIEDINGLADVVNVHGLIDLDLHKLTISDISELGKFTNLKSLDLSNCSNISDISCLSKLLDLEVLNIDDMNDDGFDSDQLKAIAGLPKLKKVYVLNEVFDSGDALREYLEQDHEEEEEDGEDEEEDEEGDEEDEEYEENDDDDE